jgi:hypothetical protein
MSIFEYACIKVSVDCGEIKVFYISAYLGDQGVDGRMGSE